MKQIKRESPIPKDIKGMQQQSPLQTQDLHAKDVSPSPVPFGSPFARHSATPSQSMREEEFRR